MYCMPIHAVSKNKTDFRLITNQSAGDFSLNSMVHPTAIKGYPLNNLYHLGKVLLHLKCTDPDAEFTLWKSDISEVYCLLPMHPTWQIKQINTIDSKCYIDYESFIKDSFFINLGLRQIFHLLIYYHWALQQNIF